jgi:hypothetical protein
MIRFTPDGRLSLWLPCLLVAVSGCLFSPREPQPPDSATSVNYLDRTSPSNVWDNLQTSLRNLHSPGWEDGILRTEFVYEPDSGARSQYPGAFEGWDGAKEIAFIQAFYSTGPTIEVTLRDPGFIVPGVSGTTVEWEGVIYDITVTDQGGTINRYRGSADIIFVLEGNFWYVSRWADRTGEPDPANPGSPALPTMGVLRGTISSN